MKRFFTLKTTKKLAQLASLSYRIGGGTMRHVIWEDGTSSLFDKDERKWYIEELRDFLEDTEQSELTEDPAKFAEYVLAHFLWDIKEIPNEN